HKNVPNTLSQITAAFASVNVNIENMANASKGEISYTIIETNEKVGEDVIAAITAVESVTRVICY
ncbi:MAG: 3-phosphoglycerate dehydrogenase, partial [Clostridia bacterium]|nr:3-phosphoglycerate dehydrogenase [Clostridia bacterium]